MLPRGLKRQFSPLSELPGRPHRKAAVVTLLQLPPEGRWRAFSQPRQGRGLPYTVPSGNTPPLEAFFPSDRKRTALAPPQRAATPATALPQTTASPPGGAGARLVRSGLPPAPLGAQSRGCAAVAPLLCTAWCAWARCGRRRSPAPWAAVPASPGLASARRCPS